MYCCSVRTGKLIIKLGILASVVLYMEMVSRQQNISKHFLIISNPGSC